MEAPTKRRRVNRSPSPVYKLDDEDESYEPYIPVAQRRQEKLAKLASLGGNLDKEQTRAELEQREDEANEEEKLRERQRKERTLLMEAQEVHSRKAAEGNPLFLLNLFRIDPSFQMQKRAKNRRHGKLMKKYSKPSRVDENLHRIWNWQEEFSIPNH
jgi:hypothetical protein